MKAVGIHVFAGGFTMGVQEVFDVAHQLEVHNFGLDTAKALCGIDPINCPAVEWPHIDAEFAYGNPRCTGFSCVTAGLSENAHGAWSSPTRDIHEMMQYAIGRYPIVIWESVQQAYTVGKELLDYLRDHFCTPNDYRIAHVFVNAASFGNAQNRKRYFFVAYHKSKNFNITPPLITHHQPTLYDAIWDLRHNETSPSKLSGEDYTFNSYAHRCESDLACIPLLPVGWDLNKLAKQAVHLMPDHYQVMWKYRSSNMPYSMHSITRTNWMRPCATLTSSASRLIHPVHDRPLTVGELSTIMGWPDIPRGANPVAQIAKGICPSVGTWLAEQAKAYLDDQWGSEDWESSYDAAKGMWVGKDCEGSVEKVFRLTNYHGTDTDEERYDDEARKFYARLDLVGETWQPSSRVHTRKP
jgi:site-specific DNA-cytosine methylase